MIVCTLCGISNPTDYSCPNKRNIGSGIIGCPHKPQWWREQNKKSKIDEEREQQSLEQATNEFSSVVGGLVGFVISVAFQAPYVLAAITFPIYFLELVTNFRGFFSDSDELFVFSGANPTIDRIGFWAVLAVFVYIVVVPKFANKWLTAKLALFPIFAFYILLIFIDLVQSPAEHRAEYFDIESLLGGLIILFLGATVISASWIYFYERRRPNRD